MKIKNENLAITFGMLTIVLFVASPLVLELFYPSKSIGQVIGENAKDLIDGFKGKKQIATNSYKDTWYLILSTLGFISLMITLFLSTTLLKIKSKEKFGYIGLSCAVIGIGAFFHFLGIGLIAIILIGLFVLGFFYVSHYF